MPPQLKKLLHRLLCPVPIGCAVLLSAPVLCLLLITHRPESYRPPQPASSRAVSTYLSHELAPAFYNNLNRARPFELLVHEAGVNDIIAHSRWPRTVNGLTFCAPAVVFAKDNLQIMATVDLKGIPVVFTVVLRPAFARPGQLQLHISDVRAGALNITPFARSAATRLLRHRPDAKRQNSLPGAILSALLNERPFSPTFNTENSKLRIEDLTIEPGTVCIRFVPVN